MNSRYDENTPEISHFIRLLNDEQHSHFQITQLRNNRVELVDSKSSEVIYIEIYDICEGTGQNVDEIFRSLTNVNKIVEKTVANMKMSEDRDNRVIQLQIFHVPEEMKDYYNVALARGFFERLDEQITKATKLMEDNYIESYFVYHSNHYYLNPYQVALKKPHEVMILHVLKEGCFADSMVYLFE